MIIINFYKIYLKIQFKFFKCLDYNKTEKLDEKYNTITCIDKKGKLFFFKRQTL